MHRPLPVHDMHDQSTTCVAALPNFTLLAHSMVAADGGDSKHLLRTVAVHIASLQFSSSPTPGM